MSELINYNQKLCKMLKGNTKEYHKWFYRNAELYNIVNETKSEKLAKQSKIKQCFDNCFKLAYKYNLEYVEGYTLAYGIPIEHAFLLDNNNDIIDPTLGIKVDSKTRFGSEYYGIIIPKNILLKLKSNDKNYLPLPYLYWEYIKGDDIIA